jgi:hypothetical protein
MLCAIRYGNVRNRMETFAANLYSGFVANNSWIAMTQKLMKTLTEELLVWRATLAKMRGTNATEVDDVIAHIDASIKSVDALRTADEADKVVR